MKLTGLTGFGGRRRAAGGPPYFVAAGTMDSDDDVVPGTVTWVDPGLPAGLQENDIMLMSCVITKGQTTTGFPTGGDMASWTLIKEWAYGVYGACWYWKRAGASETAPTLDLVTKDQNQACLSAVITAYRGCVTSGTPYSEGVWRVDGLDATPKTKEITPTTDGGTIISSHAIDDKTAWTTPPPPSGWTVDFEDTYDGNNNNDTRIVVMTYDTDSEDNATEIPAATIGTLATEEYHGAFTCCLIPA